MGARHLPCAVRTTAFFWRHPLNSSGRMSGNTVVSKRSFFPILVVLILGLTGAMAQQSQTAKQSKTSGKKAKAAGNKPAEATAGESSTGDAEQKAAGEENQDEAKGPWHGLTWRLVGPYRGGRALAVSGVIGDPHTYYFGSVGGGVWKSTDGGLSWRPMTDKTKDMSSSIGAIEVAPSDPNIIYAGTGEACIRGNIIAGNGVYKSIDAGKTWNFIGLKDTLAIGRIIVNPKNPDIVLVAALGHPFGPNAERGIFRTLDGGKTWSKVLYK